jgi:hypothetical protein
MMANVVIVANAVITFVMAVMALMAVMTIMDKTPN